MPIIRSEIVKRQAQAGGREWVYEEHEDHTGAVHRRFYLGYSGDESGQASALSARAEAIAVELAEREIASNLEEAAS